MQESLFHESMTDAIRAVVQACGGSQVVGHILWREKAPEAAGRLLMDCLNEGRNERLCPDQVVLLAEMGRARGCHAIMQYMARHLGYTEPKPVEPQDEFAELQRTFNESVRAQAELVKRMERLASPGLRSAA